MSATGFEWEVWRPLIGLVLAAGSVALLLAWLAASWRVEVRTGANRLANYGGQGESTEARLGGLVLRAARAETPKIGDLEWAQLGGQSLDLTPAGLIGRMVLFGALGLVPALVLQIPYLFALPALLALVPWVGVRSQAAAVKQRIVRSVPEIAALIAAELSAGVAPESALERAAELSGELSRLLKRVLAESRSGGSPIFSRPPVRGALVTVLGATGLEALNSFARQLDLVAAKGVAGAELMADVASALAREHQAEVKRRTARLDNTLLMPVTLFFFGPAMAAIMIPLVIMVMNSLGG